MRLNDGFTLVIPFYRNVEMLKNQLRQIERYSDLIRVIVVDDGSPEHAAAVLAAKGYTFSTFQGRLQVYRIMQNIPWNRGGARNLGAHVCKTDWLMHTDIDHILPLSCSQAMLRLAALKPMHWYRFPRFRVGSADETRKKDALPADTTFGAIKPHIDSYLITRNLYWLVGGYDEDYSGCLGGGSPFLKNLEAQAPVGLMPSDVHLHVYTRSACRDASDFSLSRDTSEYSRRRAAKEAAKDTKPKNPLRFSWERVF